MKPRYCLTGPAEASRPTGEPCIALPKALTNHDRRHKYDVGGESAHDSSAWRHPLCYRVPPNLWRQN